MIWRNIEFDDIPSREEFECLTLSLLNRGVRNSDKMRDMIRRERKLILCKATGRWNETPSDKFVNEHALGVGEFGAEGADQENFTKRISFVRLITSRRHGIHEAEPFSSPGFGGGSVTARSARRSWGLRG